MSVVDIFNGAKGAFTTFHSLFNEVSDAMGLDRALELNAKGNEKNAAAMGQMIKEQQGGAQVGIQDAANLVRNAIEQNFGIVSKVTEESEMEIVFRLDRCPVHEAAQEVGIAVDVIEAQCRSGAVAFMATMLKQLNPNLDYELLKCRSTPDGYCEEAVTLK